MLQAVALDGAVREVELAQGGDAGEALEPVVRHALVAAALAFQRVVAVVEVDRGGHLENLHAGVSGREVEPLRGAGRADELTAELLDFRFQCERLRPGFGGPFNFGQEDREPALQVRVRHLGDQSRAVHGFAG